MFKSKKLHTRVTVGAIHKVARHLGEAKTRHGKEGSVDSTAKAYDLKISEKGEPSPVWKKRQRNSELLTPPWKYGLPVKGASIKYVRAEGEGGVGPNA